MTCFAVMLLALMIFFVATMLTMGLLTITLALIVIGIILGLAFLLYFWRVIYPWLVRMGRWSAQLRNLVFLALALAVGTIALILVFGVLGQPISIAVLTVLAVLLFLLFLILAIVVWLVRLWRYSWTPLRNAFWDILFRIVALAWRLLGGIALGIVWFFYHPPLRWLVAVLLFYVRGVAAGVSWFLYHPPLRDLVRAVLLITRLLARFAAFIIYNPIARAFALASTSAVVILMTDLLGMPISPLLIILVFALLWPIPAMFFGLRLLMRFASSLIYALLSWWPVTGVREVLRRGLTVESQSYQDYKYAHDDSSGAT